ncbi:MAG: hypothetical protein ACE5J9_06810 [Methanosarcinales archaeon]
MSRLYTIINISGFYRDNWSGDICNLVESCGSIGVGVTTSGASAIGNIGVTVGSIGIGVSDDVSLGGGCAIPITIAMLKIRASKHTAYLLIF